MLTYVINTSENKTFESDRLFELAGYHRIRWMNCSLRDIDRCEKEIYEKQNSLGAEAFRVVVLVDFFGFDAIRPPYGRGANGFGLEEKGVEFAIYLPYIEAYLIDKLFDPLVKRDIYISGCEVYYIQNGEYERFEDLDDREHQVASVLTGKADTAVVPLEPPRDWREGFEIILTGEDGEKEAEPPREEDPEQPRRRKVTKEQFKRMEEEFASRPAAAQDPTAYKTFVLYCTKTMSLELNVRDYPYGAALGDAMDFHSFFEAFRGRMARTNVFRRHYYVTKYGESPARAAFDTLSLSLYLIRAYEREDDTSEEGDLRISSIEPPVLLEVLERSWNKIHAARDLACYNSMRYYVLDQMSDETVESLTEEKELPADVAIGRLRADPRVCDEETIRRMSAAELYHHVCEFCDRTGEQVERDNARRQDELMATYLRKRDETDEASVGAELAELRRAGLLKMTDQCPSREQYENAKRAKEGEISLLFDRALKADRIEVKYDDEKSRAKHSLKEYDRAKAGTYRSWIAEGICLVLTVLAMLIPYHALQLYDVSVLSLKASALYGWSILIFGALYVLAGIIYTAPLMRRMRKAKDELRYEYKTCLAKNEYAFSRLRQRYEQDLIRIEELRYELRQIGQLYGANVALERNVAHHREMLEDVEDQLSAMLNNMGVEPHYQPDEDVEQEFDLTKPFTARENGVYKIFSIETIELLFKKSKKGSDGT